MNKTTAKKSTKEQGLKRITNIEIKNPKVAGIDVSDKEMMAAYPINKSEIAIRAFGTSTRNLKALIACLKEHGITSVAMESTGVYWVPLFLMLQEEGIEVCLVNAKHVKNITGRKTDELDAEWIQKLHRCGLLSSSFQPDNYTRSLRTVVRHRSTLVNLCSADINRMQKTLELMNIKVHTVISDLSGVTGIRIIEAILAGERDPYVLAKLRHGRIKASEEEIIESLEGYYREEDLFILKDHYDLYLMHKAKVKACEDEIKKHLQQLIGFIHNGIQPDLRVEKRKTSSKSKFSFDLASMLYSLLGVDLTTVEGFSELSILQIISETGPDMSKWPKDKNFSSWLGLAPNTKESGGKLISSHIKKKKQTAGQTFRMSANGIANSKGPLGDFYRRLVARIGKAAAKVALARKLSVIFYHMVSKKEAYNPHALIDGNERRKQYKVEYYKRKLAQLEAA